jgi:leucyl aminopeptidase
MRALAQRKAKVNVVGLIGLVENMPDGNAIRPGDILRSASGQTIEVQNTDAEGRLVLCDVLWYAQEHFKPKAIVDLATLTGAIVVSLGHHHAGMFTDSDDLAAELTAAGLAEGERVWRMPLGAEYDVQIKSKFADMRNIGGPAAGSITAAQFLKRFVKDGVKWAHLDIAGVAWVEGEKAPTDPSWASGYGPRLLNKWIMDNYE